MRLHSAAFGLLLLAASSAFATEATAPATAPASRPATAPSDESASLYRRAFVELDTLGDADRERLGLCNKDGCWVVTTPLDAATTDLLTRMNKAFTLGKQAAAGPPPKWNLNGDAERMAEVTNRLPRLSALFVLQARRSFADSKPEQGTDELIMAITMSRHAVASEPTLLMKMIEVNASRPAMEVLAQQLPSLPKELLASLPARLAAVVPSPTTEEIVHGEYRFAKAAAARQGVSMMVMVGSLGGYYDKIAAASKLPPEPFAAKVDELAKAHPLNPWVPVISPSFKKTRELTAVFETKQALLDAAILIVRDGEVAVARTKDPFAEGPFTFRSRAAGGFELEGKLRYRDAPIKIEVGGSAK